MGMRRHRRTVGLATAMVAAMLSWTPEPVRAQSATVEIALGDYAPQQLIDSGAGLSPGSQVEVGEGIVVLSYREPCRFFAIVRRASYEVPAALESCSDIEEGDGTEIQRAFASESVSHQFLFYAPPQFRRSSPDPNAPPPPPPPPDPGTIFRQNLEDLRRNPPSFPASSARFPTEITTANPPIGLQLCAIEGDVCRFDGVRDVVYGAGARWVTGRFQGEAPCTNATFGDPAPNVVKSCFLDAPADVAAPAPFQPIPPSDGFPTPNLVFSHVDDGGRYIFTVSNRGEFSPELFRPAPDLPPCGLNRNSSRTWVDMLDAASGARLYGFCALGHPQSLDGIWVGLADNSPTTTIAVRLNDRLTGRSVTSNAVRVR